MTNPLPICLLQYKDIHLGDNLYKYYTSTQGRDTHYIQQGAHFFTRDDKKSYIYRGIVQSILSIGKDIHEDKPIVFKIIQILPIPSLRNLAPGEKVPKFNPNPNRGRGQCAYNRDAAYHSGIDILNTTPFRGILYGINQQSKNTNQNPWADIDRQIEISPSPEVDEAVWDQLDMVM